MVEVDTTKAWEKRLAAVSQAQGKYMWALVVLGVFYFALHGAPGAEDAKYPFLGFSLDPKLVGLSGPAVLFFLVLVIHGSARAYETAEKLATKGGRPLEAIDSAPNPIDLAIYVKPSSPRALKLLESFRYPAFLSLFVAEAVWLLVEMLTACEMARGSWVFGLLGILFGLPAATLVLRLWVHCGRRAWS